MRHEWIVRFGYGKVRPWVSRRADERRRGDPADRRPRHARAARRPRCRRAATACTIDEFDVHAGDRLTFSTTWFRSHPTSRRCSTSTRGSAHDRARAGVGRPVHVRGPYREPSSGRCWCCGCSPTARPAASWPRRPPRCPEDFGGERNWDYRFCWLRDASLTLEALIGAGYVEEAKLWRDWLLRAVAGDPQDLQIMYAVDGGRDLPERDARPPARVRGLPPGADRQRRGRPAAEATCSAR